MHTLLPTGWAGNRPLDKLHAFAAVCTGVESFGSRHCMDQLLAAGILPGAMGGHQKVRFWS